MIRKKFVDLKRPAQNNTSMKVKTDDTTMNKPVLIVAGVRASGKSTFIDALKSNNLDPAILGRLPDGVENWPQMYAKDMVFRNKQKQLQLNISLHDSIILHYDILRPLAYKMESFKNDLLLNYLSSTKNLYVVSIFPNSKQLIEQFSDRMELRKQNLSIFAHLKLYVESFIFKKWNFVKKSSSPKLKPLLLYQDDKWLIDYHKRWKAFIEDIIDPERHIELAPLNKINPGWKIIDKDLDLFSENCHTK
jgi:hypothetical protein